MSIAYTLRMRTFQVSEYRADREEPCTSPSSAVQALRAIFAGIDTDVESFVLLAMNAKGKIVGFKTIGQGTTTATLASPREVLRSALVLGAVSMLIAHNHPSGDPRPSHEDIALTRRIRAAGETIGIPLADHIILGSEDKYTSIRVLEHWDSNN